MKKPTLHQLAGVCLFISGAWLAHVKSVGKRPWDDYGPVGEYFSGYYGSAFKVYFAILSIAVLVKIWATIAGRDACRAHVHKLLDGIVAEVIRTPKTFNEQDYRVTLYQYRRISIRGFLSQFPVKRTELRWRGWLVPYERSGDQPFSRKTCFRAPKTSRQGQNGGHGACGTAWVNGEFEVSGLPKVVESSGDAQKRKYGQRTHMDEQELSRRISEGKSVALAFRADRVDTSTRKRWGVLVYDTMDKNAIIDNSNESAHRLALQALSLVLEEHSA